MSFFQIKVYDKSDECRKHYSGRDATDLERSFYIRHKDKFKGVLRYEVSFSSRWWISDDVCEKRGLKKMSKVESQWKRCGNGFELGRRSKRVNVSLVCLDEAGKPIDGTEIFVGGKLEGSADNGYYVN